MLGNRLLKDISIDKCNKTVGGDLFNLFCPNGTKANCDPYFTKNDVTITRGIKGLASGVFFGRC